MPITAPHTPVLPSDKYKGKTTIGAYGDFVVMIDDMVQQIVETLKKITNWIILSLFLLLIMAVLLISA